MASALSVHALCFLVVRHWHMIMLTIPLHANSAQRCVPILIPVACAQRCVHPAMMQERHGDDAGDDHRSTIRPCIETIGSGGGVER